jgi:hypothetical protein
LSTPALRLRISPQLPINVTVDAGLGASISRNTLTIKNDWASVEATSPPSLSNYSSLLLNNLTGGYERVPTVAFTATPTAALPIAGGTMTGAINEAPTVTLASAATVNIGAAAANTINITGTTTITAFDTIASGAVRRLVFSGAVTVTHNAASLIMPNDASLTTAAGDALTFISLGSGNWRCIDALIAGSIGASANTNYFSVAEAVATAIAPAIKTIRTLAYYSTSYGGGAVYSRVATQPTHGGKFRSTDRFLPNGTTDAINGGWWELTEQVVNPLMFGALNSGNTADATTNRVAFNAALDYHALGGRVEVTPGRYYVNQDGANPWCLRQTKPNRLIGMGALYTAVIPVPGTAATVDTFNYTPSNTLSHNNAEISGIFWGDSFSQARPGRFGIYLDTTAAGAILPKMTIRDNYIGQSSTSSYSIWHENNAVNNINGGMYAALIENNFLFGGIRLKKSGDSNVIEKNVISEVSGAATVGVYADLVTGASLLAITDNNITANLGAIRIDDGSRAKIERNNIEQTVSGASDNAMINISGTVGAMSTPTIRDNHCGAFTGTGITANIRIRNCAGAIIEGNTLLPASASTIGIDIGSDCTNTHLDNNTNGTGGSANVLDNGVGTEGVFKTPALLNSWANVGSGQQLTGYVKEGATVLITGVITGGTVAATIFTLPVGFRPESAIIIPAFKGTGIGTITVNSNGNVVATDLATAQTNSFSASFRVSADGWTTSNL